MYKYLLTANLIVSYGNSAKTKQELLNFLPSGGENCA